jgi:hypothetical protein
MAWSVRPPHGGFSPVFSTARGPTHAPTTSRGWLVSRSYLR